MSLRDEAKLNLANSNQSINTSNEMYKNSNFVDYYGKNTFNEAAMKKYLPYNAYRKLKAIIKEGGKIDNLLAEEIAHGMKEWALDMGATYFCHWFQPMTGLTAEKHDSFFSYGTDGIAIARFSGKNLSQSEPDASSFPSGGIRATFEARGYTAWDPTSPVFIMEGPLGNTMVIPSLFMSYTGEALDKKTPLLRSMEALSKSAIKILRLFGNNTATRVYSNVGPEQEYFLIDKNFYLQRPDLVLTGRTLFGAPSPKGQQMEDHYFGSIKERILAFMQDVGIELYKLGIPAKTRHNEVAPAQFEIAPMYADSNIATDHNHLVMDTLKKIANKHNLALLIHEKPFAGINGSGKHNNWSISDSEGNNLLDPGDTPHKNLQFLTFLVATITAVYRYADLLRAAIASAGNDHRLGANEAPPAIISVFLGEELDKILTNIELSKEHTYSDKQIIELGISKLPIIAKDSTDRNRTSPFAFTGNKFEFRAVGASQSIAPANYTLNAIVATVLDEFYDKIKANLDKGMDLNKAVMEVIVPAIKESKPIRFEGNNYSKEWEIEAKKRGLSNFKTTPEALKTYKKDKFKEVFTKKGILTERELEARYHIYVEQYSKLVNIEAECALSMAKTMILPAVTEYLGKISKSYNETKSACGDLTKVLDKEKEFLSNYAKLVYDLHNKIDELSKTLKEVQAIEDIEAQAESYCNKILPLMSELRKIVDTLEENTEDKLWPLPKYSEMLFMY